MSARKRRAVTIGIVAFAIWPVIQMGLAFAFGVNPWKLAGWGMYAAPQFPAEVRVICRDAAGDAGCPFDTIPADLDPELQAFLRRRLGLGGLARPGRFAEAILSAYPELAALEVEVVSPHLERESGMVVERSETYGYSR